MGYSNKNKERPALETIKIIKDFFKDEGYDIHITYTHSISNTWSSRVHLIKDGKIIRMTNGKGISLEYAVASGLGEMYERYCCLFEYDLDYKFLNVKKTKITNILNGETMYIDRRMKSGTNGMAAGNTFKEAFNQAFSELCERETLDRFVNKEYDYLRCIPNDKLSNEELKAIIQNIEASNKKVFVIDASYIANAPVVMIIMLDYKMRRYSINLGAFPIFDIALERCLTEINQNIDFNEHIKYNSVQTPYRNNIDLQHLRNALLKTTIICFQTDDMIFDNIKTVEKASDIFINGDPGNDLVYEHYLKFIKDNNVELYYADDSLSDKMSAITLYTRYGNDLFVTLRDSKIDLEKIDNIVKDLKDSLFKEYDFEKYYKCISLLSKYSHDEMGTYFKSRNIYDLLHGQCNCNIMILEMKTIIKETASGIYKEKETSFFDREIQKYALLHLYKNVDKKILEQITGFHYTDEDLLHIGDEYYLMEHIFYKTLYKIYGEVYAK